MVKITGIMALQSASRASLTIPNLITLARILLTPLFIIFLIQGRYRKALIIFLLAGLSDLADGFIARCWQQKSPLGSYLDPLADKLLMSASFVTLSIAHVIPPWLTVVVHQPGRGHWPWGCSLFRLADLSPNHLPHWSGKWTTTLQLFTMLAGAGGEDLVPAAAPVYLRLFWLTGCLPPSPGSIMSLGG